LENSFRIIKLEDRICLYKNGSIWRSADYKSSDSLITQAKSSQSKQATIWGAKAGGLLALSAAGFVSIFKATGTAVHRLDFIRQNEIRKQVIEKLENSTHFSPLEAANLRQNFLQLHTFNEAFFLTSNFENMVLMDKIELAEKIRVLRTKLLQTFKNSLNNNNNKVIATKEILKYSGKIGVAAAVGAVIGLWLARGYVSDSYRIKSYKQLEIYLNSLNEMEIQAIGNSLDVLPHNC